MAKPSAVGTLAQRLSGVLFGFLAMAILAGVVYYGLGWIKTAFPGMGFWSAVGLFLAAYLFLLFKASKHPDLEVDDPNAPMTELPRASACLLLCLPTGRLLQ